MKAFSGKQRSFKGELTDRRVDFGHMSGICFKSAKMYRSVARMGICWADMGIWSEYFLESPKRELVLGEKLWKIFIRPIPSRKAEKFGRIHAKSAIRRLVVGRDEAQQAICPMKSPENGFSDSRAVKWIKKASPGDGVSMNEGVLRETKKL